MNTEEKESIMEGLFGKFLAVTGDDPAREGLIETPGRMARAYSELLRGYGEPDFVLKTFTSPYEGLVVRKGIPFVAHCEHHVCPFPGTIDFAYIPNGRVLGLSKIIRFMQHYAARLWTQEDMTMFLMDKFEELVKPAGCAIVIEACHSCEGNRGVRESNVPTITAERRGTFVDHPELEEKFYKLVGR